jgi:hypothetical protein
MTKEVTDCQFLQYELVTMARCRIGRMRNTGENPLKMLEKIGVRKIRAGKNYTNKYGNSFSVCVCLYIYIYIYTINLYHDNKMNSGTLF